MNNNLMILLILNSVLLIGFATNHFNNKPLTVNEVIKHCERSLPPGQHCEFYVEVRKDEN